MRHLGILAHSTEGAALCFLTYCRHGFAGLGPHDHPDVTLDCIALARSMPFWDSGDHAAIRGILAESVTRLAAAGADFFVCPDNTAHMALGLDGPPLPLPGLHICEVVADEAVRRGFAKVGVLGTRYTMDGPLYADALGRRGLETAVPPAADRELVNTVIFDELLDGELRPESRAAYVRIIEDLAARGLRRGGAGLHRDPDAGHARGLAAADPRLDPAVGRGGVRRRRRQRTAADLARRTDHQVKRPSVCRVVGCSGTDTS